jgi:hypothetical protein
LFERLSFVGQHRFGFPIDIRIVAMLKAAAPFLPMIRACLAFSDLNADHSEISGFEVGCFISFELIHPNKLGLHQNQSNMSALAWGIWASKRAFLLKN